MISDVCSDNHDWFSLSPPPLWNGEERRLLRPWSSRGETGTSWSWSQPLPVHKAVPHPVVVLLPSIFSWRFPPFYVPLVWKERLCKRLCVKLVVTGIIARRPCGTEGELAVLFAQLCAQLGGCHKIPFRTSLQVVKSVSLQGIIWQDSLETWLARGWDVFPVSGERLTDESACRRSDLGQFLRACTWRKLNGDIFLWLLACFAARLLSRFVKYL